MKRIFLLSILLFSVIPLRAEPRVAVLPFDMIVDSAYGYYDDKISLLNYGNALQQMISTNLSTRIELNVIELARVTEQMQGRRQSKWNDPQLAAAIGSALGADYVVTGSYGEFASEIRVDARLVNVASGDVPPGFVVTETVKLWEDLPTAAERISEQILPLILEGARIRAVSRAILYPEGDVDIYDPRAGIDPSKARLIVWVNAPAPAIESSPAVSFARCERIDLMDVAADYQKTHACRVATMPAGRVELTVSHRGYLPYRETLTLAAGKAYRLEVDLKEIEVQVR